MKRTVFITGASSGIGRAAARAFHGAGFNVVATMRSPERDTELVDLPHLIRPAVDVCDPASIDDAVAVAIDAFGGIDVVVNNAGYGLIGAFETFEHEQIERQFATNVFGVMNVIRAVLPHMRARRRGHIVNVASFAGRSIVPLYSAYHASKWAVEGFSESLAYELRDFGIRVKVIEPGTVRTEFWGRSTDRENRTGVTDYDEYSRPILGLIDTAARTISARPDEVARTIVAAVSDESERLRYVVGADAHATLLARRLLPEVIYRRVIRSIFAPRAVSFFDGIGRLVESTPEPPP